jgi:hypothetical protein
MILTALQPVLLAEQEECLKQLIARRHRQIMRPSHKDAEIGEVAGCAAAK